MHQMNCKVLCSQTYWRHSLVKVNWFPNLNQCYQWFCDIKWISSCFPGYGESAVTAKRKSVLVCVVVISHARLLRSVQISLSRRTALYSIEKIAYFSKMLLHFSNLVECSPNFFFPCAQNSFLAGPKGKKKSPGIVFEYYQFYLNVHKLL
jgi:hypothetical protein